MSLHSRQHGACPGCQPAPGPSTAAVGGTGWTRDPTAPCNKPHMRSTMRWSIPRALPCQETLWHLPPSTAGAVPAPLGSPLWCSRGWGCASFARWAAASPRPQHVPLPWLPSRSSGCLLQQTMAGVFCLGTPLVYIQNTARKSWAGQSSDKGQNVLGSPWPKPELAN